MSKIIAVQDGQLTIDAALGVYIESPVADTTTPILTLGTELVDVDRRLINFWENVPGGSPDGFYLNADFSPSSPSNRLVFGSDKPSGEAEAFTLGEKGEFSFAGNALSYSTGGNLSSTYSTGAGLTLDGDPGSAVTTPVIDILNHGLNEITYIMRIRESNTTGFWMQHDATGSGVENFLKFGNDSASGVESLSIKVDGIVSVDAGDFVFDPTGTDPTFTVFNAAQTASTTLSYNDIAVADAFTGTFASNSESWISAAVNGATSLYHNGVQKAFTDQAGLGTNDGLYFVGSSNHAFTPGAGSGALWLDSDDDTLYFRSDAGTDFPIAGPTLTGVSSTGSPLVNEVAVFVDATTIDSDATFTWDSSTLVVSNFSIGATFMGNTGASRSAFRAITASATTPNIHVSQSDIDTGIGGTADALALISGGVEMLRLVETGVATTDQVIIGPAGIIGAEATPALAFGDGDTGFFESVDDTIGVTVAGTQRYAYNATAYASVTSGGFYLDQTATSATNPAHSFQGDTDTGIGSAAADQVSIIGGAVEANRITAATVQTTTVATTEIISLAVASGEGFGFEVHAMGTEDATGDTVFERVFGAIRNQGGTTALVGSTITDRTDDAGATTWVISVEADDTGDALTVDVTGENAHTIDWKVRVELLQV